MSLESKLETLKKKYTSSAKDKSKSDIQLQGKQIPNHEAKRPVSPLPPP